MISLAADRSCQFLGEACISSVLYSTGRRDSLFHSFGLWYAIDRRTHSHSHTYLLRHSWWIINRKGSGKDRPYWTSYYSFRSFQESESFDLMRNLFSKCFTRKTPIVCLACRSEQRPLGRRFRISSCTRSTANGLDSKGSHFYAIQELVDKHRTVSLRWSTRNGIARQHHTFAFFASMALVLSNSKKDPLALVSFCPHRALHECDRCQSQEVVDTIREGFWSMYGMDSI